MSWAMASSTARGCSTVAPAAARWQHLGAADGGQRARPRHDARVGCEDPVDVGEDLALAQARAPPARATADASEPPRPSVQHRASTAPVLDGLHEDVAGDVDHLGGDVERRAAAAPRSRRGRRARRSARRAARGPAPGSASSLAGRPSPGRPARSPTSGPGRARRAPTGGRAARPAGARDLRRRGPARCPARRRAARSRTASRAGGERQLVAAERAGVRAGRPDVEPLVVEDDRDRQPDPATAPSTRR